MLGISKTVRNQQTIERALRAAGIKGEVLLDRMTRGLYSTDASIYQIEPLAVVIPRDADDVAAAMSVAQRLGAKVLPRGGGTSLAGQAAGHCIVIDVSKYMTRILETNVEQRWVRVQPGRVRDELNADLAWSGLHFAPETATSNRANIGGMIGNNSSGTKSILYGKTIDHVLELKCLLATGAELHMRSMSRAEWDERASPDTQEGSIYRGVRRIIEENRDAIARRYPKVMRRVGGYNLDAFPEQGPWNLAHLIVGSEGTLALVTEAKLNLEPLPKAKAVGVIHFRRLNEALRAVSPIVRHHPSAVEMLDATVIGMARQNLEVQRICGWIQGHPEAVLIVEFFGETPAEVDAKFEDLFHDLRSVGFGYAYPVMTEPDKQAEVWNVRAAGLGLMLGIKGDAKPTAFIEDSAVPVEVLPDYIEEVAALCDSLGVRVAMYAHASVGLIHVRPILNLKQAEDIENMKTISRRTFDLVRKYGGSWSGEHGDGLVRSYMNERFFGKQLYEAFKEIKRLFDPEGLMNPGKIVDAGPMHENLRLGLQYRAENSRKHFHYREDGGFDRAVEMCTGVGACRKTLTGTMCPSYIATRDEVHSTRGRANALRLAMTGQLGPDAMTGKALYDVLDLCLGCKGCKAECPSNVDLAKLKCEFLAGYHAKHRATAGERFFARSADFAGNFSGRFAGLVNRLGEQKTIRILMERVLGVDRRRPLPKFTSEPFGPWTAQEPVAHPEPGDDRRVVLFDDTYMKHHEPGIGHAAVRLLEGLGYSVQLAKAGCCCRPLISHGFLKEAKERGTELFRRLDQFVLDRIPIVACEPGCLSAITDDLPDLLDSVQIARRVSSGIMMIDVFIEREIAEGRIDPGVFAEAAKKKSDGGKKFLIHGHCHQKALFGTAAMKSLLARIDGAEVAEIDSGCCGMAGSFGYEKRHYDISLKIGEDRLFPAIREMADETQLIACGFSCRHQIDDVLGVKARHFVEVLADELDFRRTPST